MLHSWRQGFTADFIRYEPTCTHKMCGFTWVIIIVPPVGGDDVSEMTFKAWLQRLHDITEGYVPRAVVNVDELGAFFKALSDKGLQRQGKSSLCGNKSKQLSLFPVHHSRTLDVHYFYKKKACIITDLMNIIWSD